MSGKFKRILYGGDYNPNQWEKEVWKEDMEIFKNAHINSATINVFSWAKLQPSETEYNFSELDEIVEMLSAQGYDIVLATSTAALPAWMVRKYPEVTRTDYYGRHRKFGDRHNACPNSLVFQKYASALVEEEAKRYASNEHVTCWHIGNEYCGECYCENCEKAFRVWLKKKYKTIEALNKAWNMEFWGHTIYDWDDIVLPNALGDGIPDGTGTLFAGISIDYKRFNSDSLLNNYKMERDIVRRYNPNTVITTNLMGTYKGLDYFKWAKEMDIVSWDNYPFYDTPWSYTAMRHDLMRGLKDAPFMIMEQAANQQSWQTYNALKRPGEVRAQSYQSIAHGADTIQFFQLRQSVGGCEKFHSAIIAHAGTANTRVIKETTKLGEELEKLSPLLPDSRNTAEVGIIFDWDNYWGLEFTSGPTESLKYTDQIHQYYKYFYDKNIPVNMIPFNADFSRYKIIVAPVLYMVKPGMKEALETFVSSGGTIITTYMSGIVNDSDNVYLGGYPGPLKELAGIWVEEIDALPPEHSNQLLFPDGFKCSCNILCELIHLEGAVSLAAYEEDFYAKMPAITKNSFGKGHVYYLGTSMEESGIKKVFDLATAESQVASVIPEETELEIAKRTQDGNTYYFIINFKDQNVPVPEFFVGKTDILTGNTISKADRLAKYDVRIINFDK